MISQALKCKPQLIIVHPNTHRRKMCHYIVPPAQGLMHLSSAGRVMKDSWRKVVCTVLIFFRVNI